MMSERGGAAITGVRQAEVEVRVEEAAGLKAVIVRGEVDLFTAPALETALDTGRREPPDLLVDLTGLDFLDCAGVRRLAAAAMSQAAHHRGFAITAGGDGEVARLFEALAVSGLELPVYTSRADALRAALGCAATSGERVPAAG